MVEWQFSQPLAERVFSQNQQDQTSPPMINWGPEEKSWGPHPTCRQVGNQIVCDDIYGDNKPAVARTAFSVQDNDAFRSITALQMSMGLLPGSPIARASDTQAPPYFPPGVPTVPMDQYTFNQGGQIGGTPPGPGRFDPWIFNQGDKTPLGPIGPIIPPPDLRPGNQDVPLPPIPTPVVPPKPIDVPAPQPPRPAPQPYQPNPYQPNPCQPGPCQPGRGGGRHWYPGMIAGRVIGRIFGGGRGRCR